MLNVLLLEPNAVLGKQYAAYLNRRGYQVDLCAHAQAAIALADAKQPSIVVMELLLAGHSGVEFIHEFRSYTEWRKVPVIILSRLPRDDAFTQNALKNLGVVAYLYKSEISLEKLGNQIDKYCLKTVKKS